MRNISDTHLGTSKLRRPADGQTKIRDRRLLGVDAYRQADLTVVTEVDKGTHVETDRKWRMDLLDAFSYMRNVDRRGFPELRLGEPRAMQTRGDDLLRAGMYQTCL